MGTKKNQGVINIRPWSRSYKISLYGYTLFIPYEMRITTSIVIHPLKNGL